MDTQGGSETGSDERALCAERGTPKQAMAKKNPVLFIPVRNMKTSLIGARLEELASHTKAVSNILLATSIAFC